MKRPYLRFMTYAALLLLVGLLKFYSHIPDKIVISISLILVFLILFTFIFKTNSPPILKMTIVIFSLVALPMFILSYTGVLEGFSNPLTGILIATMFLLLGIVSVIVMFCLDYAELKWE